MSEPFIEVYDAFDNNGYILRLIIPRKWLVRTRYPRLRITLLFIKTVWMEWRNE